MDLSFLNPTTIILFAVAAVAAYLLGSLNFAIIFTKIFVKKDVRDVGSGNAGMTNAFRAGGKITGILTLIFDFAKTIASVAIGRWLLPRLAYDLCLAFECEAVILNSLYGAMWCGLFVIVGHLFPVFFGFRGGKGVITSAGTILLIDWRLFLICIGVFIICFAITKIISISSMISSLAFPVAAWFLLGDSRATGTIFAALIALIIIVKHKDNIKRLLKGEEKRMSFGKKSS